MFNFKAAAEKVIEIDAEFGHAPGKLEIANSIWANHMSPIDRLEVMNEVGDNFKNAMARLRACTKLISRAI